ncbi:MAG: hypothetical protein AAB778_00585 [Patescibacteria group bacterium]
MASKLFKNKLKSRINKKQYEYNGPDLMDINAKALIAFGLMVIAFVLTYSVFMK